MRDKTAAAAKSSPGRSWRETRLGDEGAAQKRNPEGRQAWEIIKRSSEWRSCRETSLRQGRSGSQEQPRRDIMKGDKLGRQSSPEGNHEGKPAWETRRQAAAKARQREPRAAQNEDHKGRHSLGNKTAATGKIFPPLLASFRPPPLASSTPNNFHPLSTTEDGNCQFRALSDQLYGSQEGSC